ETTHDGRTVPEVQRGYEIGDRIARRRVVELPAKRVFVVQHSMKENAYRHVVFAVSRFGDRRSLQANASYPPRGIEERRRFGRHPRMTKHPLLRGSETCRRALRTAPSDNAQ